MLGEMLDECQYFSKRVSFAGTGDGRVLRKCQAVIPPPGQRVPRSSFGLTRSEINNSRLFGTREAIRESLNKLRKPRPYGRGAGVGRGRGVGVALGAGVAVGVGVGLTPPPWKLNLPMRVFQPAL
jgi:hypothetical protein